jgi:hypothetical protein
LQKIILLKIIAVQTIYLAGIVVVGPPWQIPGSPLYEMVD